MCFSEIAQAQQASPVCGIKLAAVFIDLGAKSNLYSCFWGFIFSWTSGDLGRRPTDLSPLQRWDDMSAAKSSNFILTTWVWRSRLKSLRKKQSAWAFLQESEPRRNGPDHLSRKHLAGVRSDVKCLSTSVEAKGILKVCLKTRGCEKVILVLSVLHFGKKIKKKTFVYLALIRLMTKYNWTQTKQFLG